MSTGRGLDVALGNGAVVDSVGLLQTASTEILVVDLISCLLEVLQVSPGGGGGERGREERRGGRGGGEWEGGREWERRGGSGRGGERW